MTTAAAADWPARARSLSDDLLRKGAVRSEAVAEAFCSVPRHAFISGHWMGAGRTILDPERPLPELLDLAYADRGIMTHTPGDEAGGFSSASQPSIVARMLEAAQLEEGMRVLEIGAGTGYNAALIAHITRGPVTTVETSPVVAEEARQGLRRVGGPAADVQVVTGDGYAGHDGKWDRITVTCGVTGVSPDWLLQLAAGGFILAPLAHAGTHPLTRVTDTCEGVVGQLVTMADFMNATGPLYAGARTSPSTRGHLHPAPVAHLPGTVPADLEPRGSYTDLWMYLAAWDPRITCASTEGLTGCALVESDTAAVLVQPGGLHLTEDTPALRDLAHAVADQVATWEHSGRPAIDRWACRLTPAGEQHMPIYSPNGWTLTPA